MTTYLITQEATQRVGFKYLATFRISKFEDDSVTPENVYMMSNGICQCPAWPRKEHCKHNDIVDRWLAIGDGRHDFMYDADADEFVTNPFADSAWQQTLKE